MALFTATATIYVNPSLKYGEMADFHTRLDKGINDWVHKAEVSVSGLVVVDFTINNNDSVLPWVIASYRSSVPTEVSLQVAIDRALSGEDE